MPRGAYAVLTLFILSRHAKIFEAMNNHLVKQPHHTQPCEAYTHAELNTLARLLFKYRSNDLAKIYEKRADKRAFHFDESSLTYVMLLRLPALSVSRPTNPRHPRTCCFVCLR